MTENQCLNFIALASLKGNPISQGFNKNFHFLNQSFDISIGRGLIHFIIGIHTSIKSPFDDGGEMFWENACMHEIPVEPTNELLVF